jgi:hypothetical protein
LVKAAEFRQSYAQTKQALQFQLQGLADGQRIVLNRVGIVLFEDVL